MLGLPTLRPGALPDNAPMRGWVVEVREQLRELSEHGQDRWHLFFYGPQTAAGLLGPSWNRMPRTQLWDDLGPGRATRPRSSSTAERLPGATVAPPS